MSVIDTTTEVPVLAAPTRPEGRMSLRQFLRVVRENILATYAPEDFDKDFIARRLLWRRTFVVNEPNGVRHVLLDNAQNYKKSELSRRILEPGLGRGLITTDGELWRRHRRIMARKEQARAAATAAAEKVNRDIQSAKDTATRSWSAVRAKISADINHLKADVAQKKHDGRRPGYANE